MKKAILLITFFLFAVNGFSQVNLQVTNSDYKSFFVPGTTNTYTITVVNFGPLPASNVSVSNAIPNSVTNYSWTGPNGKSGINTPVSDLITTMPSGSISTYTVTFLVPASYTNNILTSTVAVASPGATINCDQCSDTDNKGTVADIVVTNTDNQLYYTPGASNVYTVKVTNNGPLDASNVKVNNLIPGGVTDFKWTGSNLSSGTNVPLNNTIALLKSGESVTYTITLVVPTGQTGPLTSQATATSATSDTNTANNTAADTDTELTGTGADIVVTNTDSKTLYNPSSTNIYVVRVVNNGPQAASNVHVVNPIPAGIPASQFSWTGSNGSSGTGVGLDNTIANLPVGSDVTYTVTVKIPSTFTTGNLTSQVTYTSDTVDPNPACTQCTDVDSPTKFADLEIVKTDNQGKFLLNTTNTYTIVIANKGPNDAVNVVVQDQIPPGIQQMNWKGSNGRSGSGELNDVIASLPVGQMVTYTVSIQVGPSYSPPDPANPSISLVNLINKVIVTSDTVDPTPSCPGCTDTDTPRENHVTIDTNRFTVQQLVTDVLINSPCVNISGFSSTQSCGFGYFHRNNSDFPIKEGMVIRNGQVKTTEGQYNSNISSSSTCSGVGDPELKAINCKAGNCGDIFDSSSVKFSFLAGGNKFSFRYLFASNEYGTYQCNYSDAFAFILTDVTPGVPATPARNLAVVPGTTTPVSVTNIRKQAYNPGCPDANPTLFGQYNAAPAAAIAESDINMIGQTVVLTASADVIAGHTYSIKLVIGDYQDSLYDSAVFIEAGSFVIGQPDIVSDTGITDNLALCEGTEHTIKSGEAKLPGVTYSWKRNGVDIPGANDYFITITQDGVYSVTYSYSSGCQQTDDYTVTYSVQRPLQEPIDLSRCSGSSTFDLTVNEPIVLGGLNAGDFDIRYYNSQADADSFNNPIANPQNYPGSNNETVFMTVEDFAQPSDCIPTKTFRLFVTAGPSGTIEYVEDGGETGFCRDSNTTLVVTKSSPFTEGGTYSVSPNTGLTLDTTTGTLNLTNAVPGDYVVSYKVLASSANGCGEYTTSANVKVLACVSTVMDPIDAICEGGTAQITLTCTDAGPGVVYTWSDDVTGVLDVTTAPTYTLPSIPTVAGNYTYTVVVSFGAEQSAPSSQVLVVHPTPVATITAPPSVCSGDPATVTFSGTPGATVTYNDGTSDSTIQLSSSGTVGTFILTTPNLTSEATYTIVSVEGNTTPSCPQNISPIEPGSTVTIAVIEAPVATVAIATGAAGSICMGEATEIGFIGSPGAEVEYTKNGVMQPKITLDASGQETILSTGILNEDTLYEIVSVVAGAGCQGLAGSSVSVDVIVIPEPALKQNGYICLDAFDGTTARTFLLDTGLDDPQYTFEWYYQDQPDILGTQYFYEVDKEGQYKVIVTDVGPLACQRTATSTVLTSVPPTGVVAEVVTGYFDDNATIVATIAVSPYAPADSVYEYQLDFGPFQDSNTFTNVAYGPHVVTARDKNACNEVTSTVTVINYPRYFTPNGDGYNDEWNISVLNDQPNSKIYIFDRFGKLLKQISPVDSPAGWDGTYNGRPMPSDDYWFVVKYQEQLTNKEFKAHFSLKR